MGIIGSECHVSRLADWASTQCSGYPVTASTHFALCGPTGWPRDLAVQLLTLVRLAGLVALSGKI